MQAEKNRQSHNLLLLKPVCILEGWTGEGEKEKGKVQ